MIVVEVVNNFLSEFKAKSNLFLISIDAETKAP
jgi:hypothetical protein